MASRKKTNIRLKAGSERAQTQQKTRQKRQEKPRSGDKGCATRTARRQVNARGRKKKNVGNKKPGLFIPFIKLSIYWCFVLTIWAGVGIIGLIAFYGAKLPSSTSWKVPERPPNIKIIASDGQTIANRGITGGRALLLDEISPYIPQAVIAIEDRRFYDHPGIDLMGLLRAAYSNIMAGHTVQGGSTLTQQLAKNLFLSPQRTIERKVQEVLLSFWLEQEFTKDQILAMYLNRVYFGSGAYGVESAARRYFNKPASDINLVEAAILAGLLKAPSRLSPARNLNLAEARGQVVLKAMQQAGFIDDQDVITALTRPQIRVKNHWKGSEHFAADRVMSDLKLLIGNVKEDLVVETTLDLNLQKHAEHVLRTTLDKNGRKFAVQEGAIIVMDRTGGIKAFIGGRDYATSQFNRASDALRQPGSTFKPFVYTAAFEKGWRAHSIHHDAPVKIGNWTPKNYDRKYNGPVSLSYALSNSLNTIAAQLVMDVGAKNVIKTARRFGIEAPLSANASLALGTSEVTLLELTSSYVPFMNGGFKAAPYIIKRISTMDGKHLFQNTHQDPPRVMTPDIAHLMNDMLVQAVRQGTGRRAQIDNWRVGGKTGTSQAFRDALFIGYTSHLTAGVWLGNDNGQPTKKVTGGSLPAQIWQQVMSQVYDNKPQVSLPFSSKATSTIPIPVSGGHDSNSEPGTLIRSPERPVPDLTHADSGSSSVKSKSLLDIILGK